MSTDQLFTLHERVGAELAVRLIAQKKVLEDRLRQVTRYTEPPQNSGRRPYPQVSPKFRNPEQPSETWTGRGKQPRWLTAELRSGKRIDDFRIEHPA
jgi:DNA-binding protein H-NS